MSEFMAELELARKAALAAGEILARHWRQRSYTVRAKSHDNPVTSADLEAEGAIRTVLTGDFSDYGWLSEESADNSARLGCERVWILDPLDGTKEFINGVDEFAVAIALAEQGVPVVGVTYNPIRRELFWAAKGAGCHRGRRQVRVSHTSVLERATVLASRTEFSRGEWQAVAGTVRVAPTGSVAYKLALVAAGMGDGTFTRSPKSEWDIAAGAALLAEAGGRLTGLDGRPIRFNQARVTVPGLVASNGLLHERLLTLANRRAAN